MTLPESFRAMVVREMPEGHFVREISPRRLTDLPPGDLLIEVTYSSLNYKDALSASGNKGVTRSFPHTPGIDAAGRVVESAHPEFAPGSQVIVTGFDLGMNTPGGFGRYIRVPAAWALKLPSNLTMKDAASYGTAGLTAALAVWKMQQHGLEKTKGEILVTGATGGVGSIAVAILAKSGFTVVAATGKAQETEFLISLGAKEVIPRSELGEPSAKPLLKGRWAGVVDAIGGTFLANAIKSTKPAGLVACCGNAASADLNLSVYPFILRGVSLLGIDSAECPVTFRQPIWEKISKEWKLEPPSGLFSECSLDDLSPHIDRMLRGETRGRLVVSLDS